MDTRISCYIFLKLCLVRFSTPQTAFNQSVLSTYHCPKRSVEVIVSPLVTPTSIHVLQLSWNIQVDVMPGDYVALYNEDVTNTEAKPLFSVFVDEKEGWVTSDIQQNKTNSSTLLFSTQCLGYWIAYKNNATNAVLASSCLKTEPRWMEKYQQDIENLALKNVFFPGTHNSGSYLESDSSFYESVFHKYVYTQDETVLNQLILGVRYLDLRVGYYPDTDTKWWLNHNVFLVRPLKFILDDVILFVKMTKEIVILDVHAFPVGFKFNPDKVHAELQNYLIAYLGDNLVPTLLPGWTSTLRSVWNTGRQIILSYNKVTKGRNQIWSSINQKWGNVQNLESLKNHVDKVFQRITRHPWAIMAELTATFFDVVTDHPGGLRKMAHAVNRNVTRWFQGDYGKSCNIVAVDFLKNTGLVQSAIDWNRRKGLEINC